jgi:hypothetical protein
MAGQAAQLLELSISFDGCRSGRRHFVADTAWRAADAWPLGGFSAYRWSDSRNFLNKY